MKRWISATLLLGCLLSVGGTPAYAVDEAMQVHFLKELFEHQPGDWPALVKANKGLFDNSFFERCDARIHWALENNQLDDALRFALLADFAAKAVNRPAVFRMGLVKAFQKNGIETLPNELLQQILLTDPQNGEAAFLEGAVQMEHHNYFESWTWFKKSYDLGYKKDDSLFHMADIDFELRKDDQAEKEMRDVLKINPDHQGAKAVVAQLDAKHALEIKGGGGFTDVPAPGLKTDPKRYAMTLTDEQRRAVSAFDTDGEIALKAGDLKKAELDFENSLKLNNQDVACLDGLGAVNYRKGTLDVAIQYLRSATHLDPTGRDGWSYLGNCLERRFDTTNMTDLTQAVAAYQKSSQLAPNDPISQMDLRRAADKKAPAAER